MNENEYHRRRENLIANGSHKAALEHALTALRLQFADEYERLDDAGEDTKTDDLLYLDASIEIVRKLRDATDL